MTNTSPPHEETHPTLVSTLIGRPRTVLHVRCGAGRTGTAAARRGAAVVGLEGDPALAERARRLLSDVVHVDPGDVEGVSRHLGSRKFDLVILGEVLGSASDPAALLRHYAGYLEPEGHLLLSARGGAAKNGASHRTSAEKATSLAQEVGLEVLRVDHGPGALPALRGGERVVVTRRPVVPRPLSLTVGMLTMNEEESIERMMNEIRRVAPDAQILCVDSSTKDRTPEIAERMGARVIRQLPPRGHGPAMEVLMYEASKQGEALIYLDCDFTYPPNVIPDIRRILESGVDVVNAARTRTRPDAMPLPNYLANKSFALLAQATAGAKVADLHSGMRGYRSSVTRAFSFDGTGDAIPIDTLLWPAKCGYRVVEVPIDYQERVGVSKLRKMAGTVWTFIRLAKTLRVGERGAGHYEVWNNLDG